MNADNVPQQPDVSPFDYGHRVAEERLRMLQAKENWAAREDIVSGIAFLHVFMFFVSLVSLFAAFFDVVPVFVGVLAAGWLLGQIVLISFWATFSTWSIWLRYLPVAVTFVLTIGVAGMSPAIIACLLLAPVRWLTGWRCECVRPWCRSETLPPLRPRFALSDIFEFITLCGCGVGALLWLNPSVVSLLPWMAAVIALALLVSIPVSLWVLSPRSPASISLLAATLIWLMDGLIVLGSLPHPWALSGGFAIACSAIPCIVTMYMLRSAGWRMIAAELENRSSPKQPLSATI